MRTLPSQSSPLMQTWNRASHPEADKENRLPSNMVRTGKQAAQMTPGRRNKKASDNQYFDIGRVGRKTGITLPDKGIRDEHGLEPVSGIFSSPVVAENDQSPIVDLTVVEDEDDINTINMLRQTPRFPPARSSTPRHTNIGSPKRMSSVRAAARSHGPASNLSSDQADVLTLPNRVLDFGAVKQARKSMVTEIQSPFKPKKVLRRSNVLVHAEPSILAKSPLRPTDDQLAEENLDDVEQSIEISQPDDYLPAMDDDRSDFDPGEDVQPAVDEAYDAVSHESPSRQGAEDEPQLVDQLLRTPPPAGAMVSPPSSKKRASSSLNEPANPGNFDISEAHAMEREQASSHKRRRPSRIHEIAVQQDGQEAAIDPHLLAHGDEYDVEAREDSTVPEESIVPEESTAPEVETQQDDEAEAPVNQGRVKGKKNAKRAPKEHDSDRAAHRNSNSRSPSKANATSTATGKRIGGTTSNVNLRATTPFEDAEHKTSRSGRNLIKPLKYWENESLIWKQGSIEGIVRADPVVSLKTRAKRKKRGRRGGSNLRDVQEESESESIMPDEWEETHGIISGNVATYNPTTNVGDPSNPITEDLAFAASAIITRDVVGSDFKFAKILSIPFFGAGIIELPPEGYKRTKNSRRMQMLFFVHEGKVMVEVGATGMEVNQFALTKGGVWSVPRGNNYAIFNESRTRPAKVFFAQGCVLNEDEQQ